MAQQLLRRFREDRAQILALVAIMLTMLLGFTGLIVDGGIMYAQRRQVQNAADAAATAGARELLYGGTASAATTAALNYALNNGYNNNGASNTVTVQVPPTTGPHTGDTHFVEVTVREKPNTFFIHVLTASGYVRARGVAGFVPVPRNYALLVLNPSMCSAYNQSSGNTLTINGGGSMVNSSCHPSGSQGGGSTFTSQYIDYYAAGSWSLSNNASDSVTATTASSQIADPLASMVRPVPCTQNGTPAGCVARSSDSTGTANNPRLTHVTSNTPVTLHPGTFYGGLKFSGSGAVTLLPGLYVIAGGGLDYSGTSSITGNGVTIFNTYDSAAAGQGPTNPSGAGACASMSLQGNGVLTLTPPSSGTYKNMLFWQDPACTDQMKYAGSTYTTPGVIYLPTAQLNISGGGNLGAIQIIVDSFSYTGSASVTLTYGNYVQIAAPRVALVE